MPERNYLTRISVITDCDTSMYQIGEIDGVFSEKQLKEHIEQFGADNLNLHLCFLISQVAKADREIRLESLVTDSSDKKSLESAEAAIKIAKTQKPLI